MKKALFSSLQVSLCTIGYLCSSSGIALTQVTTDGTVNTIVTPNGNVAEITGGETRESNLFHSFQDFSVGTGNEAFFNNANDISNIFSRVTGGNISNIDGLIRANGSASLFLINPAGIIFGENASLSIGGSFYGSSANSILFENGEFSAADLDNPPLLTINAPIGLGFRDNPAEITNSSVADDVGLQVLAGQKINLLGGDLNLAGGKITAPGGVINLGGLSTAGTITIGQDGNLSFPDNVAKANVLLTDNAVVDITANGGGLITVNADNLELTEASLFLAGIGEDLGSENAVAGTIQIDATRIFADNSSQIRSDNLGIGQAGTVNINTDTLDFDDNSAIVVSTFGQGNAGTVNITAQDVSFEQEWGGIYSSVGLSRIATEEPVVDAKGDGGKIKIDTGTLSLTNGASILVNSAAQGNAGNINITAKGEVSFSGEGDTPVPALEGRKVISGTFSQVQFKGVGNSGQINIEADSLNLDTGAVFVDNGGVEGDAGNITLDIQNNISLDQGALILAQVTEGSVGNGGNINIAANSYESNGGSSVLADTQGIGDGGNINIDIEETISLNEDSIIQTELGENAVGNAGDITITTNSLILNSSSSIEAQTEGQGDAGEISINAKETISLANDSQISSQVNSSATGNGGNITLTSGELNLTNESRIIANTDGQSASQNNISRAGNIDLDIAGDINLDNGNQIQSQVGADAVGNAGNITINTGGSLISTNGNEILTGSDGNGNGGDIQVIAGESIEIGDNSKIITNTGEQSIGDAGTITLEAGNTFSLSDDSSVLSQIQDQAEGNAGNINITANTLIVENNANISSQTLGQGTAGDITINATENISLNNNSVIESNVDNPDVRSSNSDSEVLNNSAVGDAGDITINTGELTLNNNSGLNNTSFARGNAGDITVNASGRVFLDGGSRFSSDVEDRGGEFDAVGNAGTIDVKAQEVTLNDESTFQSSTSGQGNAGNVIINTTGNVTFDGNFAGIFSQVTGEGVGNGGNIQITAGNALTLRDQSILLASASEQGQGDAGSVILNADDIAFSESLVLSQIQGEAQGNAGGIDITANTIDINNFSLVSTNAQEGTSGEAGSINLNGTNISINSGSVVDALTENGFNGGNIKINGGNLEIVSGGVVVTSAASVGNAGSINLNLTGDITINGEGAMPRPGEESIFPLTEQVLNDLQESTGLFATSSEASIGNGGNIEVSNAENLTVSSNGKISVDSQGEGNGGILTINTDSLNLDNQAAISAITASGNGGNINLAVDDTIRLENNSTISTQASDNGNGGNIEIDTNFIIAFPNQNNDIVANAQEGAGGNITITAKSVLGLVERDSTPPNNTNDIDASSEFGLNGTVSIITPDTNAIEGAIDLPNNIVEIERTTTQACNAGVKSASQNNLTLKGRDSIRSAPDLPLDSQNILINGEFSNSTTSTSTVPKPIETSQGKIQLARGIQVTKDGGIVLTAYRTNNSGDMPNGIASQRLPEGSINCDPV